MSRNNNGQPSCVTQSAMSLWIWMRHKMDPKLRRATAQLLAGNSLENAKEKIEDTLTAYVSEEEMLQGQFGLAINRIKEISNNKIKHREIRSLAPKLTKLKRIQAQIHSLSNQINVLDRQIDSFRTDVVQTELLTSLRDSITVLKETSRDQSQTKCVDDVLDDMDEVLSKQQNFNESIALPLHTNTMVETEDSDILTELFSMFDDESDARPPGGQLELPKNERIEKGPTQFVKSEIETEIMNEVIIEEDVDGANNESENQGSLIVEFTQ